MRLSQFVDDDPTRGFEIPYRVLKGSQDKFRILALIAFQAIDQPPLSRHASRHSICGKFEPEPEEFPSRPFEVPLGPFVSFLCEISVR